MKIFLIGMPGSGKSTLGRELSRQLGIPFVDLDKEIEDGEGKTIPEIFLLEQEEGFRKIESAVLTTWADKPGDFVIATGGGAPCYGTNMEKILGSGVSIFIDVPVAELINRMSEGEKRARPLLNTTLSLEENLENLRKKRLPFYEKANIRITPAHTPADVANMLR